MQTGCIYDRSRGSVLCDVPVEADETSFYLVFSARFLLRQMKQVLQLRVICEVHAEAGETDLITDCSL